MRPSADSLELNEFAFDGTWEIDATTARLPPRTPRSASGSRPRTCSSSSALRTARQPVEVLLDGKPVSDADAGSDVTDGVAEISKERLYRLVELDEGGRAHADPALRAGDLGLRLYLRVGTQAGLRALSTRL